MHLRFAEAQRGIAEERRRVDVQRPAVARRHAAVDGALVIEMLVAEREARLVRERQTKGRVHAIALDVDEIAVALRVLVHPVHAQRQSFVDGIAEVGSDALVVVAAAAQADLAMVPAFGSLRHTVDHAAAAAATEDHGVRPLEYFDALGVV